MKRSPLKRRTPLRHGGALGRKPLRRKHRHFALQVDDGVTAIVHGDPQMPPESRAALIEVARAAVREIEGQHDPAYLAWVRRQPCCAPGCLHRGPCEAHHHNLRGSGVARKAHDRYAMPLCLHDHVPGIHALAGRFKGWTRSELKAWQDEQVELHRARYEEQLRLGLVQP